MKYLLDTCVISEFTKRKPNQKVLMFLDSIQPENLFLSVLSVGEIQKGISKLDNLEKRNELFHWMNHILIQNFLGNLLDIDFSVVQVWGEISGLYEKKGIVLPVIDSLLVATCIKHNLVFMTRNVNDIKVLSAPI